MNGLRGFAQSEGLDKNFHKRGDGGLGSFELGRVAQIAEGLRGDGADGGAENLRREGEAGGFQEREEVRGGGSTSEGDGVGVSLWAGKKLFDLRGGSGRDDSAVGRGDGDLDSGGAEGFRQMVAGGFGADEEETSSVLRMREQ